MSVSTPGTEADRLPAEDVFIGVVAGSLPRDGGGIEGRPMPHLRKREISSLEKRQKPFSGKGFLVRFGILVAGA